LGFAIGKWWITFTLHSPCELNRNFQNERIKKIINQKTDDSMNIDEIRKHITLGNWQVSVHAEKERYEEDISLDDIETAIRNGKILENCHDDVRGKSCLILGYDSRKRPIHIICGYTSVQVLRIITVYLPQLPKWLNEKKRSR